MNHLVDIIIRHKQLIRAIIAAIALGAYMLPVNAFALGGSGGSGSVTQTLGQSNSISASNTGINGTVSASGNTQTNIGANVADVHIGSSGTGIIPGMAVTSDVPGMTGANSWSHSTTQTLLQANSIDASNSGTGGTVVADNNTQTNIGINAANVRVNGSSAPNPGTAGLLSGNSRSNGNNGGTSLSDSQLLGQSNSIDASNTGAGGTVLADNNTQTNIGVNAAHIRVGGSSGIATQGLMGWLSGNNGGSRSTTQTLGQSNSITANNTGGNGAVSVSGNTQTNFGINAAHLRIGSFSGTSTLGLVGSNDNNGVRSHTTDQTLRQTNSIGASNSGTGGIVLADNNVQTHIGINAAHIHIPNFQNIQNILGQILNR